MEASGTRYRKRGTSHSDPDERGSSRKQQSHSPRARARRSEPLIKGVLVEAWSEGGERRAFALGWLHEIAPSRWAVTPFALREVGGANIPFDREAAIPTPAPATFDQATAALTVWATDVMAHAPLHR